MRKTKIRTAAGRSKMARVMGEYKRKSLRSGSKRGPRVRSRAQAVAIGLSEARKAEGRPARRSRRRS
jgi:hypothetical protein